MPKQSAITRPKTPKKKKKKHTQKAAVKQAQSQQYRHLEKWLAISIYRPPSQDSEFFLNSLIITLDHFTKAYHNYLIMGDFNLEPPDKRLGSFLNSNNLVDLVITNRCFKGTSSCIDLILTNRKYSFQNITSYETGLSNHHHMILTMLKITFQQKEPKCFIYRDYKNFTFENFKSDLRKSFRAASAHMIHLTTISPPTLISMLQKRKRYFGEMKSLIRTKM